MRAHLVTLSAPTSSYTGSCRGSSLIQSAVMPHKLMNLCAAKWSAVEGGAGVSRESRAPRPHKGLRLCAGSRASSCAVLVKSGTSKLSKPWIRPCFVLSFSFFYFATTMGDLCVCSGVCRAAVSRSPHTEALRVPHLWRRRANTRLFQTDLPTKRHTW